MICSSMCTPTDSHIAIPNTFTTMTSFEIRTNDGQQGHLIMKYFSPSRKGEVSIALSQDSTTVAFYQKVGLATWIKHHHNVLS